MVNKSITKKYLKDNPDHIFVFGDNLIGEGKGGAAYLRDEENVYGFVTKKYPNNNPASFYNTETYRPVFDLELKLLISEIENNPEKTYLISKIGFGLSNIHGIFQAIIYPEIIKLKKYTNVRFLFDIY